MSFVAQVIHDNEAGYNAAVAQGQQRAAAVQPAVDAFTVLSAPAALTTADLPRLLADPRGLLLDKLTNGTPLTLGGIAVSRERAMELITWPAGTPAFLAAVAQVKDVLGTTDLMGYVLTAGVLTFDVSTLNRDGYRTYATTQKQLDYWEALTAAADALNSLRDPYMLNSTLDLKEHLADKFLRFPKGFSGGANNVATPGRVEVDHQAVARGA